MSPHPRNCATIEYKLSIQNSKRFNQFMVISKLESQIARNCLATSITSSRNAGQTFRSLLLLWTKKEKTLLQMPSKIVRMKTVCRMWHIRYSIFFCEAMLQHMQRLVSALDNSCSNTVQQSVQISLVGQAKQPRLEILKKS